MSSNVMRTVFGKKSIFLGKYYLRERLARLFVELPLADGNAPAAADLSLLGRRLVVPALGGLRLALPRRREQITTPPVFSTKEYNSRSLDRNKKA